ncbi:MAG: NnrS family protein [Gammaproteobacteria bacterium]|nr:NnrS family protein [Gammaproteobacteria bacterium]
MLILDPRSPPPTGFALFNLGFRPFFLAAALWAVLAMALWGLALAYPSAVPLLFNVWHGHEMLFGYAVAVIAGFLLTAARNWTGVRTPQGVWLAAMLALWAAPLAAMLWVLGLTFFFAIHAPMLIRPRVDGKLG